MLFPRKYKCILGKTVPFWKHKHSMNLGWSGWRWSPAGNGPQRSFPCGLDFAALSRDCLLSFRGSNGERVMDNEPDSWLWRFWMHQTSSRGERSILCTCVWALLRNTVRTAKLNCSGLFSSFRIDWIVCWIHSRPAQTQCVKCLYQFPNTP